MGGLNGLDYTLESRLKGTIVVNVRKENVPEHLIKFADAETSSDFMAVIRRLPDNFRAAVNGNGSGNARKEICFRNYNDPYTERGILWIQSSQPATAFFFLTPRALGLPKAKLLGILDQAEKAVGENVPSR